MASVGVTHLYQTVLGQLEALLSTAVSFDLRHCVILLEFSLKCAARLRLSYFLGLRTIA